MKANYHTHTRFCKHANGTEREYVENAIKAGMKILGFSDHSPQVYGTDYVSCMRMELSQVSEYINILRKLKEEYKNDIEIHIGFEAEYYPEIFEGLKSLCCEYGVEYLILGQHHLSPESKPGCFWCASENTDEELLKRYVDLITEGISTGSFSYIAHPDIFNFKGDEKIFLREMERLCVAAKEHNMPLEYNLLGAGEGRHYPKDEFFSIAKRINNDIIIGCDTHSPEALLNTELQTKARAHLEDMGLNVIETLTLNKIYR